MNGLSSHNNKVCFHSGGMRDTYPVSTPLLSKPTENSTGTGIRGWQVDLCFSVLGLATTILIAVRWGLDPANVVFAPLLAFTIPLIVFPWLEYASVYLKRDQEENEYAYLIHIDVFASVISFMFALAASWGVMIQDAATGYSLGFFCPTSWPVDPFHIVSISFVSALVNRRERKHAWYEFLGVIIGIASCTLMLFAIESFTNMWYIGSDWVDRVYTGTTEPFPNVTRVTHAATSRREMFYGRFACAIACTVFEFIATFARATKFALSRCGVKRVFGQSFSIPKPDHPCSVQALVSVVCLVIVLFLSIQAALILVPYPRWVVYDSRHVALLAAVAYFCTPQETEIPVIEGTLMLALLALGVVTSTIATVRTMSLVARTLASTQDRQDVEAEVLITPWSVDAYKREFVQGASSFLDVYHYTNFHYAYAPTWFATTSVVTHVSDAVLCVLGSSLCALMVYLYVLAHNARRNGGSADEAGTETARGPGVQGDTADDSDVVGRARESASVGANDSGKRKKRTVRRTAEDP